MNTTGERVEITPELLETIAFRCAAVIQEELDFGVNRRRLTSFDLFRETATPENVLALVARIRKLESEREKEDGYRDGSVLSRP